MMGFSSWRVGLRAVFGAATGHAAASTGGRIKKLTLDGSSARVKCDSTAAQLSPAPSNLSLEQFLNGQKAQKWLELNADKRQSCLVNTDTQEWIQTGANGVKRKLIERLGGEVARATTIVQFAPDSSFPSHVHEGGEEFIVLNGDWHDDWATQPTYTYVRNYIGSKHTPRIGGKGCTILVKLCQMSPGVEEPDHSQWDISAGNPSWKACTTIPGRSILNVYQSPYEEVRFERWPAQAAGQIDVPNTGEEVFVVEGSFTDDVGEHREWSWCRNAGERQRLARKAGPVGCLLYVKSGHLHSPEVDIHALQHL